MAPVVLLVVLSGFGGVGDVVVVDLGSGAFDGDHPLDIRARVTLPGQPAQVIAGGEPADPVVPARTALVLSDEGRGGRQAALVALDSNAPRTSASVITWAQPSPLAGSSAIRVRRSSRPKSTPRSSAATAVAR